MSKFSRAIKFMGFFVFMIGLLFPLAMYTDWFTKIHRWGDDSLPDRIDSNVIKSHNNKGLAFSYLLIGGIIVLVATGGSAIDNNIVWWPGVATLVGLMGSLFIMFTNQPLFEQWARGNSFWQLLKRNGLPPGRIAAILLWIGVGVVWYRHRSGNQTMQIWKLFGFRSTKSDGGASAV